MNNTIKNIIIFLTGAGIGGATAWLLAKSKYEQIANEEIEDVKDHYASKEVNKMSDLITDMVINGASDDELAEAVRQSITVIDESKVKVAENRKVEKPSIYDVKMELDKKVKEYGYSSEETEDEEEDPADSEYPDEADEINENGDYPHIIEPVEFGNIEDYGQQTLIYYADGYLADANTDELMNDVEEKIGWENLDRMGTYEDDALHIRNDEYECYYEILRSEKKFKEREGN